jgi:hypothetical protein
MRPSHATDPADLLTDANFTPTYYRDQACRTLPIPPFSDSPLSVPCRTLEVVLVGQDIQQARHTTGLLAPTLHAGWKLYQFPQHTTLRLSIACMEKCRYTLVISASWCERLSHRCPQGPGPSFGSSYQSAPGSQLLECLDIHNRVTTLSLSLHMSSASDGSLHSYHRSGTFHTSQVWNPLLSFAFQLSSTVTPLLSILTRFERNVQTSGSSKYPKAPSQALIHIFYKQALFSGLLSRFVGSVANLYYTCVYKNTKTDLFVSPRGNQTQRYPEDLACVIMTASLSQQTVSVKDAAAVRKRRRRAPAGGAADDCFTCSKRNIKCDRRRPYCSQCLEIGNECSGYKTQLTWGVGVASRGKLRGLSLPIAKAPPVSREPRKSPVARSRANSTAAVMAAHWVEQEEVRRHRGSIDIPSVTHSSSASAGSYPGPGYEYLSISHPESNTANVAHHGWGNLHYSSGGLVHSPDATPKYAKFPLPLITDGLSSSVDSVSDVDYLSPLSQTYSRDEMPFGNGSSVMYDGYAGNQHSPVSQSPPSGLVLDHHPRVPTSCPSLAYAASEHGSSLSSHLDPFDTHLSHKLMRECDSLSEHHMAPCPAFPF